MEIPFKITHDLAGLSQPFSLLIIQNLLILIKKMRVTPFIHLLTHELI